MYDFHDEVYYVVRRSDGRPLAVLAWMTHPEAACAKVVSAARLPVRVLLELCRVTVTGLSSCVHNLHEENHDVRCQRQLFEEPPAAPAVRLPLDVQKQSATSPGAAGTLRAGGARSGGRQSSEHQARF
jgi:hypothetical protein